MNSTANWLCDHCGGMNVATLMRCDNCSNPRDGDDKQVSDPATDNQQFNAVRHSVQAGAMAGLQSSKSATTPKRKRRRTLFDKFVGIFVIGFICFVAFMLLGNALMKP